MNLYIWKTDIGIFAAHAPSIAAARIMIMNDLQVGDAALPDLKIAIAGRPVVDPGAVAILVWHQ